MSNLVYDSGYIITLSNNNLADKPGVLCGNGKLALYNSMTKIGAGNTMIAVGELNFDQVGKYKNNIIEGFAMNDVRLFDQTGSNISYEFTHQTVDMAIGRVSSVFHVRSNNLLPLTVQNDITPLRQYPYCVLQKVTITAASNTSNLDVMHTFLSNSNLTQPDYNNNVIYNDRIYSDKGLYIMSARATHLETASSIACASCYFDSSNLLGFNVMNKKSGCFQQMRISSLAQGATKTIYILTAMMSNKDFVEPVEELKRILMNIVFKTSDTATLLTQLEAGNAAEWERLWESDVELVAKDGVTQQNLKRVMGIKRYIRQSLYNIFCCIRDGVNSEINPLSLSYVDTNGNLFFDGDIWLVPTLLLLRPSLAKIMLDFKYRGLEQAIQLAASFGYKGSKYPYENDVVGYKNVYWDVSSPLHVFNNAVIAINAWNYYRLTQDREWLTNKGYMMMKNVADFLISNIDSSYNMTNIIGLSNRVSTNHAFTKYVTKLALKYTLEASYDLSYAPKASWILAYQNLDIPYELGVSCDLIRYDETFSSSDTLQIADPWLILLPYYSYLYFNNYVNQVRDHQSILRNLTYYESKIASAYVNTPINLILRAALYGLVSQSDTSYLNTFYTAVDDVMAVVAEKDYWGSSDLTVNGLFVFLFLTVMGGIRITGGITEGKFYYEQYGLAGAFNVNMPNTWKNIVFSGVGENRELYNVVNNISASS
jgi:trehalose/maltose hydrolase-like predicted phosphorylase